MKLFITGWDGLLGRSLVPLLRRDHDVSGVGIQDGDICDRTLLRSRMEACNPDTVLHLAAMTAVDRCEVEEAEAFRVNAEGSRVVAAEAERLGARVVALSTDYVFDGVEGVPYSEEDRPYPLSVYGRSKLAAEEAIKGAATRWMIVRTAWLYGPGGPNFIETIIRLMDSQDSVAVVNDQKGSPSYTVDVSEGLARLVSAGAEGLLHLANTGEATWYDLARETATLLGADPQRIRPISTADFGRPAQRPPFSVLSTETIRTKHNIELRGWESALAAYLSSRPEGDSEEK